MDFNHREFSVAACQSYRVNRNGLTISMGGKERQIGADQLLLLERIDKPLPIASKFIAILSSGDSEAGQPKTIHGDNLIWNNPALGDLSIPMKSLSAIVSSGEQIPIAVSTEDVVTLRNKDTAAGILTAIDATSISVQQSSGEVTNVPLDSIAWVKFATTAALKTNQSRGFRVTLADGTAITAEEIELAEQKISAKLVDGTNRALPLVMVVGIEQIDGPVVWLSSLSPVENIQTPFLDVSWPAKFDRAVDNEPIRFGDRTFSRGIGVHSYSRLVFAIDPAWHSFRTQYAIAGNWLYANVNVRIRLDEKIVHEQNDFRSGTLAPPIVIPINGEHQLILEVDYGQNDDVQDRFNWIEPAFLTASATTQPKN